MQLFRAKAPKADVAVAGTASPSTLYVLDIHKLHGELFTFLDICASVLTNFKRPRGREANTGESVSRQGSSLAPFESVAPFHPPVRSSRTSASRTSVSRTSVSRTSASHHAHVKIRKPSRSADAVDIYPTSPDPRGPLPVPVAKPRSRSPADMFDHRLQRPEARARRSYNDSY